MNETTTYELRKLQSKDLFLMTTIISKIGIREFKSAFDADETKALLTNNKKDADFNKIGASVMLDIASIIISNLALCEKDIYKFLSSLSGLNVKDIEELDFVIFTQMIVDLVKKEEFKDFFMVVSKLFK